MNIGPALRAAIVNDSVISPLLGLYNGGPSVHTRRPVPDAAGYPMVVISGDVSITDFDAIDSFRSVIVRDIAVYGQQDAQTASEYRTVEEIGYLLRTLFHRNKDAVLVDDYHVIDVRASGPRVAPTEDEKSVGRVVTVSVRVQPTG